MESRRSHTNLNYLTLSPITSRLPIDGPNDDSETALTVPTPWTQRTSYISGKSAPTTPGVLSRSSSRTRLGRTSSNKFAGATGHGSRSYTHLSFAETTGGAAEIGSGLSKSKSAAALAGANRRKKMKSMTSAPVHTGIGGEWLNRTGTILWEKSRESKGQSWLVSRDSSTSLVLQEDDDYDQNYPQYESIANSATVSRTPSRAPSARTSRRGSRAGSRPDLTYFTASAPRTPGSVRSFKSGEDYFGSMALNRGAMTDPAVLAGPDFVDMEYELDDEDEDEYEDEEEAELRRQEEEVRKLTDERGMGLGRVVDKLLGWPLFDLDSAIEAEEDTQVSASSQRVQNQAPKPDPKSLPILRHTPDRSAAEGSQQGEEAQGWSDAAWLLSVATKVLF